MRYIRLLPAVAGAGLVAASLLTGSAAGSQLIERNARDVALKVSPSGRMALLTYRAHGRMRRVAAWGAVNARAPSPTSPQVGFALDYSGRSWRGHRNACRPYDGPALYWLVAACRARDGSYWAVQSWQRLLQPGQTPGESNAAWELHLSHWRGELAQLTIKLDWAYRRFDHVYGSLSYRGQPVYGFNSTRQGAPLDRYGRNVYLDTFNSSYGGGWRRENGFLTHRRTGAFCYLLSQGKGEAYRATVVGPGVTPDVFWQSNAPGPYDSARDLQANNEQRQLFSGDRFCWPN